MRTYTKFGGSKRKSFTVFKFTALQFSGRSNSASSSNNNNTCYSVKKTPDTCDENLAKSHSSYCSGRFLALF
ncbi:unnamed protein product [Gongylonema pulchrum]|uniref:Ovule protein n=1 Tax=Gongylonema pulchrum TaxID=637853 RepID=A0A183DQB8_9BILA|nr:unnamed protein product [Gongylonema pulchrum]